MLRPKPDAERIAQKAERLYARRIRRLVEPHARGKFLVMNVETGEYEIDVDPVEASERAAARFGDAPLFTIRVGFRCAYRLGSRFHVPDR